MKTNFPPNSIDWKNTSEVLRRSDSTCSRTRSSTIEGQRGAHFFPRNFKLRLKFLYVGLLVCTVLLGFGATGSITALSAFATQGESGFHAVRAKKALSRSDLSRAAEETRAALLHLSEGGSCNLDLAKELLSLARELQIPEAEFAAALVYFHLDAIGRDRRDILYWSLATHNLDLFDSLIGTLPAAERFPSSPFYPLIALRSQLGGVTP